MLDARGQKKRMTTVLVTGANRGIGLALTGQYVQRGCHVVATMRNPATAGDLKMLARETGKVRVIEADATDEVALAAAAAALGDETLDIVICNAGVMSDRGGISDPGHGAAEWQRVLMANVTSAFLTARAFLPHLKRAEAGKLAFISSQMGSSVLGNGKVLAYRASKAAVSNLGVNLAVDLKPAGIAVGIYHPGWVSSDIGGKTAPVTPVESAKGLVQRIDTLSLATTGVFEDYQGNPYIF